jgi:hypothetical protein
MDYFPRSQAVLGMGKAPSSAWVAIGFPSATWEPEDKVLGGTGILLVPRTGWKPVPLLIDFYRWMRLMHHLTEFSLAQAGSWERAEN